ncbi:MAG: hypothetical protein KA761_00195 [Gemmatimonadaceae bacterium]|nr:hypothetical protein [Gemmatimonadaceae bacterium]
MPVQQQVGVTVAYGPELVAFGTPALANSGKYLRRVSSSLIPAKESFQSNEARPDYQVSDLRHGLRRASGGIQGELSTQTYDDWVEAAMRGTWTAGAATTQATLGTATFANTGTNVGTVTFSLGDPVAVGFRVGDVIRFTSGVVTNLNQNFRIVSFGGASNRTVTVAGPIVAEAAVSTWAGGVAGRKLSNGVLKRSFTIEQIYDDLDTSERYVGCRIGGFQISAPPGAMATISFDVLGQGFSALSGVSSPYFTTIAAAPNTGIMAGPNGSMRAAGAERAIVTGFDFSMTNGLSSQAVVGSNTAPDVFYSRQVMTGNISAYFDDLTLVNAFINESEVDIVVVLESGAAAPYDFLTMNMQRVKFSGISRQIQTEDGVIVSFPFQALLKTAATGYDGVTFTMQRSNA